MQPHHTAEHMGGFAIAPSCIHQTRAEAWLDIQPHMAWRPISPPGLSDSMFTAPWSCADQGPWHCLSALQRKGELVCSLGTESLLFAMFLKSMYIHQKYVESMCLPLKCSKVTFDQAGQQKWAHLQSRWLFHKRVIGSLSMQACM